MDETDIPAQSTGPQPAAGERAGFVHLHVHSAYSLLEGAMPLDRVVELAVGDGQPALAVTDRNNLFGALEFSQKAAAKGLQPIMGCKLSVAFPALDHGGGPVHGRHSVADVPQLVLLAMNEAGFSNLCRLVSQAHLGASVDSATDPEPHASEPPSDASTGDGNGGANGADGDATVRSGVYITAQALIEHSDGLIVLTGGPDGPLDALVSEGRTAHARAVLEQLGAAFGDRLYVELQRHGPERSPIEGGLIALAYDLDLPLVATNQPYFAAREDHEAHDALICIAQGTVISADDRRRLSADHYFKSAAEMAVLFADLPEALANTVEIARRCTWRANTREPILPRFFAESEIGDDAAAGQRESEELARLARGGLDDRLGAFGVAPGRSETEYRDRLEYELGVIEQMGFPGYFLIVADFIGWAKARDIPVGPGRGSGAGSLVAWALKITDPDPMRFSLLFERFLNPERLSMPDFDIDFCQDRREEVIRYVQEKYGHDQVAQIITFGTLQARAVLRDVGRVLQMPYGQVDRIAKLVPFNPANPISLGRAIEDEPRLAEAKTEDPLVGRLFDIAMRLEGLYRHASTHAAGIVIGDRPLDELIPLYRDPRSDMPVTQYNMKWVEPAGLVKFDFLGLKTLTVLKRAVDFAAAHGKEIDLDAIALDDKATFEMLSRGETVGVFQLESAGMRKALIGMRPDRFEDIIALVALYRPGPMDNIPVYNARKNGEEQPDFYHDKIRGVLEETYGVIIYQEQVLEIARILSGYSLGEADFLRKAMGKKIKSEMDAQRSRFVDGAVERGLEQAQANMIFDVLAKFAGYGFNKAHATAYALISYQTAWMKCHHPVEFMAASMQLDIGNTDKLAVFYQEAATMDIEVVAPSVASCEAGFSVHDNKILYGLAAIKGVGEGAIDQVVAERLANGPFTGLTDLFTRIDARQMNRRTLESLICAGALDCFGQPREAMLAGVDRLLGHASRTAEDRARGQSDMFTNGGQHQEIALPAAKPWMPSERLFREHQAAGFYLSAHPLDEYRAVLERMRVRSFAEFEKSVRAGATAGRLAGTITSKSERRTRTGKRMGVVLVSDPSGQYEAVVFEETLAQFRELLEPGQSVVLQANADLRPEGVSVRVNHVESLEEQAKQASQNLRIFMRDESPLEPVAKMLGGRGKGRVSLVLVQGDGAREVELELKERYAVSPQIASAIKSVPGVVQVETV